MSGKKMSLLFVIDSLGSGGAQRQMVILSKGLARAGYQVEFFVYHIEDFFTQELERAGIPVRAYVKPSRFSVRPVLALRSLLRERRFDVVLAFLSVPSLYAELASIGLSGPRVVVSERSMFSSNRVATSRRLMQEMHRMADYITVNSYHQRDRMIGLYPWMLHKIRTVYNGYDLSEFRPRGAPNSRVDVLRLVAVGSVSQKKNPLNLAKAMGICWDRYRIRVEVDWVGRQEMSEDGRLAHEGTCEYLKRAGINDRWRWLGERQDIAALLGAYDALVHPSYFEGLSNAICEALCCGLPVLAGRVCDHVSLVQEGVRGFLFDPNSAESIAEVFHKFDCLNDEARACMGMAARSFAETNLSYQEYTRQYIQLFQELCEA